MTILLGGLAFEIVTGLEQAARKQRFKEQLDAGFGGPMVIAEGDSWFCYPQDRRYVPANAPQDLTLPLATKYKLLNMAKPGDLATEMAGFREKDLAIYAAYYKADVLILSCGGNDLVHGRSLQSLLHPGDLQNPADYLKLSFWAVLERVIVSIEEMIKTARRARPDIRVITHGYDRAIPRQNGAWFGEPMAALGIPQARWTAIAQTIVNEFNIELAGRVAALDRSLANGRGEIVHLDLRGTVGANEWFDELHPTTGGFAKIAAKFDAEIKRLAGKKVRAKPAAKPRQPAIPDPFANAGVDQPGNN